VIFYIQLPIYNLYIFFQLCLKIFQVSIIQLFFQCDFFSGYLVTRCEKMLRAKLLQRCLSYYVPFDCRAMRLLRDSAYINGNWTLAPIANRLFPFATQSTILLSLMFPIRMPKILSSSHRRRCQSLRVVR
jgi:hypothetical protein